MLIVNFIIFFSGMFLSGLLIETVTTHRNWIKYSLYGISVSTNSLSLCYYSLVHVYPVHTFAFNCLYTSCVHSTRIADVTWN